MTARRCLAILFLAVPLAGGGTVASQPAGVAVSGSVKSLLLGSRTFAGEDYTLGLNRARLELKGEVAAGVALDIQYDQELLLGSYLDTTAFRAAKDVPPPQYWRLESNTVERGDLYGRHRLHRAAVTLSRGVIDLKLGRQRIAWGTGRFWSPLDILNPVNPLAIEREERLGIDAVLLEAKTGPLSRVSLVHAPAPDRGPASRAVQWHGNAGGVDGSIVAGRLAGLDVAGIDMASQLGQAGVRAELARLENRQGQRFTRAMLGLDYAFPSGLTVSTDLYFNGAGVRDPLAYDLAGGMAGGVNGLATRYAGLYASYEITPLLKWTTNVAVNLDDRSRGVDSRLVWSWRPKADLTVGVQRFSGNGRSEYGRMPNAAFAQWQWFF